MPLVLHLTLNIMYISVCASSKIVDCVLCCTEYVQAHISSIDVHNIHIWFWSLRYQHRLGEFFSSFFFRSRSLARIQFFHWAKCFFVTCVLNLLCVHVYLHWQHMQLFSILAFIANCEQWNAFWMVDKYCLAVCVRVYALGYTNP